MTTRLAVIFVLLGVLFVAVSCMAQPAGAQAPFQTPTPLPEIKATLDAAPTAKQTAQDNINQADQMDAKAAELRRNGIEQGQQIDKAISDARTASAAQNAAAIGEAIGRADANLSELNKTNAAQAELIATLTVNQKIQAGTIISMSNEADDLRGQVKQLKSDKQTLQANYDAQAEADKGKGDVGSYAVLFAFIMCAILLVSLVLVVLQRRREPAAPPDPPIDSEWRQTPLDADRAEDDSASMSDAQ